MGDSSRLIRGGHLICCIFPWKPLDIIWFWVHNASLGGKSSKIAYYILLHNICWCSLHSKRGPWIGYDKDQGARTIVKKYRFLTKLPSTVCTFCVCCCWNHYMYNHRNKALFSSCRLCKATLSPYTNNVPNVQSWFAQNSIKQSAPWLRTPEDPPPKKKKNPSKETICVCQGGGGGGGSKALSTCQSWINTSHHEINLLLGEWHAHQGCLSGKIISPSGMHSISPYRLSQVLNHVSLRCKF